MLRAILLGPILWLAGAIVFDAVHWVLHLMLRSRFGWLTAFAIGVRLFLTFYMVPSGALGPETKTHYDERTRLVAYRWLIGWMGALVVAVSGWLVFFADREVAGDGRLDPANYPHLGLFVGILASSGGTHSDRMFPPEGSALPLSVSL